LDAIRGNELSVELGVAIGPSHALGPIGIKWAAKMKNLFCKALWFSRKTRLWIAPIFTLCIAFGQESSLASNDPANTTGSMQPVSAIDVGSPTSRLLPDLPPLPSGKSTAIGGEIKELDRVRDELHLQVPGSHEMKIAFDVRTKAFRDGKPCPVRELRVGDHVSVETMLDGSTVFARSIHSLTRALEGQVQGQVIQYNPAHAELLLRDSVSSMPFKLHLLPGTDIARSSGNGRFSTTDLAPGTLITADFLAGGKGSVKRIVILATPGSSFAFQGKIDFLDVHSGKLVIIDPRDEKRYEITFDEARLPDVARLHEGSEVSIQAHFDGTSYEAFQIVALRPPADAP